MEIYILIHLKYIYKLLFIYFDLTLKTLVFRVRFIPKCNPYSADFMSGIVLRALQVIVSHNKPRKKLKYRSTLLPTIPHGAQYVHMVICIDEMQFINKYTNIGLPEHTQHWTSLVAQ